MRKRKSARCKKRLKRGGQVERVDLEEVDLPSPMPDDDLLALDEALDRLAATDARAAELVKLCFFVGMTQEQAAKHLGVSISTVERTWFSRGRGCFGKCKRGEIRPHEFPDFL